MSLGRYLRRISRHQQLKDTILHYDSASRDLRTWFWFVLASSNLTLLFMLMHETLTGLSMTQEIGLHPAI